MNKQQQPQQPQAPEMPPHDKIEIKFTDLDLQYVTSTLVRKERIVKAIDVQFAEALQHFAAMVAKKRNIQWDDNKFIGVTYDMEKEKCYLLLAKEPIRQAPESSSAASAAAA